MWELLYETFWDRLEHFCFNLCRDEARAEDLTQEVFLRALQNRTLINSFTERQCKAWLFIMASAAGAGAALWLHRNNEKENELCFRKRKKSSRNQRNCAFTR